VGILIALLDNEGARYRYRYGFLLVSVLLAVCAGAINIYYLNSYGIPVNDHSFGFDNPIYHVVYSLPNFWINNRYLYTIPIINLFFGLLLIVVKSGDLLKPFFENRVLVWVGNISYGIYIYHLGLSYLFGLSLSRLWGRDAMSFSVYGQVGLLLVYLGLLLGISALSYYTLERRFLDRRRPYRSVADG
jgi:hypothetical protein